MAAVLAAVVFAIPAGGSAAKDAAAPVVFPLSQIPAVRVTALLHRLYPAAAVHLDAAANAVVVVASPADLASMRAVIAALDVRSPLAPAIDAVPVQRIDARATAARLRALFPNATFSASAGRTLVVRANASDLAQIRALVAALDAAPPPPSSAPSATDTVRVAQGDARGIARQLAGNAPRVRVRVAGDALILSGAPDDVERAKSLAAALDQPAPGVRYTQLYRIRAYDAASVGDLIRRGFAVDVTVDRTLNALTVLASAAQQRRIADAIAQLDTPASAATGGGGAFELYTLRAAVPGINGNGSTSAADVAATVTGALANVAPDLRITVSPTTQQLVLTGTPYAIRTAHDLLDQLDVAQKLVVLDTQVLEVDETVAKNLGLSLPNPVLGTTFTEATPPPDANGNAGRIGRVGAIGRTPLSLAVQLNLLIQHGTARVLADPRITTLSGRTATIRAGDTITIATTTGGGAGTIATTQLQTFQTGVSLDITPVVNAGNYISVLLHPTVNSQTGFLNGIPQISTRDTQTTVALQADETLVIGGLIQESVNRTETKIPVLGDLPLIGRVFRDSALNTTRNELIITVTPHIVAPGALATLAPPAAPGPALPTLPPATRLPAPRPFSVTPAPQPAAPAPVPATPVAVLAAPTPSALAALNTFTYGAVPQNNFARSTDPVQVFYVALGPTVVRRDTVIVASVVTSTNAQRVTLSYGGFSQQLAQLQPGSWQARFVIPATALPSTAATVSLQLVAQRADGSSATVPIPVSLTP